MSNNSVSQQISAQMEPLSTAPVFQQSSAPHKKTVKMHSMSRTPQMPNSTAQNKRMVRNESLHRKSGSQQSQTPKNRTVQMEPSPMVQTESFESVRSKMRESIAAALALVSELHDKAPNEEKSEVAITPQLKQEVSQSAESTSTLADAADRVGRTPTCTLSSKEFCFADKFNDGQNTSQETLIKESMGDSAKTWKCDGQELQCDNIVPDEDVSFSNNFFVKDEFLQGNGLSWEVDLDMEVAETNEVQIAKKPKLIHQDGGGNGEEQAIRTPQKLTLLIEAELFKLFGGVNKKYKEKGRSLLFNLKDRNNPELRERVLTGEISPEKLCSMTAEELASKELSQWRMAKAEELAQMVVLPESDVNTRRLVKKTHKGEFQVEVEQDDSVSVEVSVGTSSLTPIRSKNKETKAQPPSKSDGTEDTENVAGYKSSSGNQDRDGTDLMQGLMVDEFKDSESLPLIVSLDEFIESLDSEPPFENLPVGGGKKHQSNMDGMDSGYELVAASKNPVNTTPDKTDEKAETDKMDVKYTELDVRLNSGEGRPIEPKTYPPCGESKVEHIWEGVLKLNISAMVTVFGYFRSGEKASTKDWPNTLEIKGRVRLDAFKKFLQELPMSRSRAVMVAQFVLKEGSSENESASLSEVVDSYILEERLGFAEAAPGVEIYICPPHTKIFEILSNHLPNEALKSTDVNGLIGVVVWRRIHSTSTISPPNSSSRHKHSTKNQHLRSRRRPGSNENMKFASKPAQPQPPPLGVVSPTDPQPLPDEEDDIPPGFGPAPPGDEDDLPEFNFSGSSNLSMPKHSIQNPLQVSEMTSRSPSHPVDHVRELIHKYGQPGSITQIKGGNGVGVHVWNDNDDEDDDIPEWRPPVPEQQPPPQPPRHCFGQQPMLASVVNQQLGPTMPQQPQPLQPSVSAMQGAWLARPPGPHGLQPSSLGQYYGVPVLQAGMEWRQGTPSSRGF